MSNNQIGDIPSLQALANVSPQRLNNELFARAYKALNSAVTLAKDGTGSQKAFLKFALFCDSALKARSELSSSKVTLTKRQTPTNQRKLTQLSIA